MNLYILRKEAQVPAKLDRWSSVMPTELTIVTQQLTLFPDCKWEEAWWLLPALNTHITSVKENGVF